MRDKVKAAFFSNGAPSHADEHIINKVYGAEQRKWIFEHTDLYPEIISIENFEEHVENLTDLDVIFSTWLMPSLGVEQIARLVRLKAVFYAAGATQYFREPFLEQGIKVCSATSANAIPVAEFALAQILLAGAGYFLNSRECSSQSEMKRPDRFRGHGNYGGRVSILGNGSISSRLQELLSHHTLEVLAIPSRAQNRTVSLGEAFSTSFAVVNLFPDRDDNAGVFNEPLFDSMMKSSVFINVGRGRQVNEDDLIRVMRKRPDLTALLDVQWPEPPVEGSELYTVPNIRLSSHIAGSKGAELIRMADYMIEEFIRYERGEPLRYEVDLNSL